MAQGIFISHASEDAALAEAVVENLPIVGSGIARENIFFSSGAGTKVPAGEGFQEYIRKRVKGATLVVAVITPKFVESAFCLAEVGAAWIKTGKLFPIAVPYVDRDELKGALAGIQVELINNASALGELNDAACEAVGRKPSSEVWEKPKERFLASLPDLLAAVEPGTNVSREKYDEAVRSRDAAREGARDAERELAQCRERYEILKEAKTREDAIEAALPEDLEERFNELAAQAEKALGDVPTDVATAIFFSNSGKEMPMPHFYDERYEHERVQKELERGMLRHGQDESFVIPDTDFPKVRRAVDAVEALDNFLRHAPPEFEEWFEETYEVPVYLSKKAVWDAVLGIG